jgi:hypothetical protein
MTKENRKLKTINAIISPDTGKIINRHFNTPRIRQLGSNIMRERTLAQYNKPPQ